MKEISVFLLLLFNGVRCEPPIPQDQGDNSNQPSGSDPQISGFYNQPTNEFQISQQNSQQNQIQNQNDIQYQYAQPQVLQQQQQIYPQQDQVFFSNQQQQPQQQYIATTYNQPAVQYANPQGQPGQGQIIYDQQQPVQQTSGSFGVNQGGFLHQNSFALHGGNSGPNYYARPPGPVHGGNGNYHGNYQYGPPPRPQPEYGQPGHGDCGHSVDSGKFSKFKEYFSNIFNKGGGGYSGGSGHSFSKFGDFFLKI